jgi:4-hydroxy-tetrahydrodipicolinate synthase
VHTPLQKENIMFKGSIAALVTPFKNGKVDYDKLKELVEFQITNGINGILPCGTTGESPTLPHDEHQKVVETCIQAAGKRVPILAGTGSNSTAEAVSLTQHAEKAGADGALVVTPYYNKPTQEGLYQHFKAVADSVRIQIVLYNIAGRTSRNIETPTVARLVKACKNIIGVKEASGSLDQASAVRLACGDDFLIFSGDDSLTLPLLSIGGVGVISVLANIMPKETVDLVEYFQKGDIKKARALHFRLLPLIKTLFSETNPIPIKAAMNLMGLCSDELRLPMTNISKENLENLKKEMHKLNLI